MRLLLQLERFRADPDSPLQLEHAEREARAALSSGDGLSAKEVEAQDAFTQMRDEILCLSDGVEVNEILGIIDNHTPEWV